MANTVDEVFAALASPTRRELLGRLLVTEGEPVQRLTSHFDMTRPSVSEHLKVLRDAGLVTSERVGRQRIYRLADDALRPVQDWLEPYERFWRDRLKDMAELLDAEEAADEEEDSR